MKQIVGLVLLFIIIKAQAMDNHCNGAPTTVHENGGGEVALSASVEASVYVGPNASVCEYATVTGNTQIGDNARVFGYARIGNGTVISGNAQVYGNAVISSTSTTQFVTVTENASIFGNAIVAEVATIKGDSKIFENARVSGTAQVDNSVQIFGNASVSESVQIKDSAKIHGVAVLNRDVISVSGSSDVCTNKKYPSNTILNNASLCPDQPRLYSTSQIAIGESHTCIVLSKGRVRCWGNNAFGQLGNGNTNTIGDDELPTSQTVLYGDVNMLAAGTRHTCALLKKGNVRCWGANGEGELGYGNTTNLLTAGGDVNLGESALQIAAGSYHTCALLSSGAVKCWGYNGYGQLGIGNNQNVGDNELPSSIANVDLGAPARFIAAGVNHTCAVLNNGSIKCWGFNNAGQLGNGTLNISNIPVNVPVSEPAIQVSAGIAHTCALFASGNIRCWGYNNEGELGLGNTTNTASPGDVINPGNPAFQISSGQYHNCALFPGGGVKCWGWNAYGQLGRGTTENIGDNEILNNVSMVSVGDNAYAVVAGGSHTCALLSSYAVRCWGLNANGQLGYGNTTNIGDNELPSSVDTVTTQFIGKTRMAWRKNEK